MLSLTSRWIPKSLADVDLSGDWLNTPSGSRFLLRNEGTDDRILIFATDGMLHRLCEVETIYVDGTKGRKVVQHEENIKRLIDEFVAGNRTLESFLTSISFCVVSFD